MRETLDGFRVAVGYIGQQGLNSQDLLLQSLPHTTIPQLVVLGELVLDLIVRILLVDPVSSTTSISVGYSQRLSRILLDDGPGCRARNIFETIKDQLGCL